MSKTSLLPVTLSLIERRIYLIHGQKVMLDFDLAELYQVSTKILNQTVKRNKDRFPTDFMFQLTLLEARKLLRSRSQIVTLNRGQNIKYAPYAFTEQGVAMLSSVLRSKRAIQVNIAIMRTFVKLRELLSTNKDLAKKLAQLEKKYDSQFKVVFEAIKNLMQHPPETKKEYIGFRINKYK